MRHENAYLPTNSTKSMRAAGKPGERVICRRGADRFVSDEYRSLFEHLDQRAVIELTATHLDKLIVKVAVKRGSG